MDPLTIIGMAEAGVKLAQLLEASFKTAAPNVQSKALDTVTSITGLAATLAEEAKSGAQVLSETDTQKLDAEIAKLQAVTDSLMAQVDKT